MYSISSYGRMVAASPRHSSQCTQTQQPVHCTAVGGLFWCRSGEKLTPYGDGVMTNLLAIRREGKRDGHEGKANEA